MRHKPHMLRTLILLVALLSTVACAVPLPVAPEGGAEIVLAEADTPRETSLEVRHEDLAALVAGNQAFALDLYRHLGAESDGDLFFSPYSISAALAMTYAGARGTTETQMANALHFTLAQDRLHPAFNQLDLVLSSRGEGAEGQDDEGFRLNIANAIWGQQGYDFEQAYLETLATHYGAGLRLVDFVEDAEAARRTINGWVSEQTEGRIEELIPQGALDALTRLVLTNAIYFNAAWASPFEEAATADGDFYLLDGSTVEVPLMFQSERFGYAEGDGYQVVELPYDGGEMSMVILLPDAGAFEAFEQGLDQAQLAAIFERLSSEQVNLTMPRFETTAKFGLVDALSALGMPEAFTEAANFSGIDGTEDLLISDVFHEAFVAVDEAGTEAAAATAVIVGLTSAPADPKTVTVDRPFIYLIRDIETGTLLFVGRTLDPQ